MYTLKFRLLKLKFVQSQYFCCFHKSLNPNFFMNYLESLEVILITQKIISLDTFLINYKRFLFF